MNEKIKSVNEYYHDFGLLGYGSMSLFNNMGSEIKYTRYFRVKEEFYFTTGALCQQERTDVNFSFKQFKTSKLFFRNIGIHVGMEKRVRINNGLSIGLGAGLLLNKSININKSPFYNYSDTFNDGPNLHYEIAESLSFKTSNWKVVPHFELNTYFKCGKHLVKVSGFYQFEAKKYNSFEYNLSYANYKPYSYFFERSTYITDHFRMKILGINVGYCF